MPEQTLHLARQAAERGAAVVLFPGLGLSAYAIDALATAVFPAHDARRRARDL